MVIKNKQRSFKERTTELKEKLDGNEDINRFKTVVFLKTLIGN